MLTIYININLLKSRFKSAFTTLLKVFTTVLVIAGILIIIGTAGASDSNTITLSQTIKQTFQGFFLCGVAYILNFIKIVMEA